MGYRMRQLSINLSNALAGGGTEKEEDSIYNIINIIANISLPIHPRSTEGTP